MIQQFMAYRSEIRAAQPVLDTQRSTTVGSCSTSGTTMQHVDSNAVKYFETMNSAQRLYMDSMRIALDPLASCIQDGEMRVQLRTEFSNWALPQHTLLVHTSPQCVKTFVFLPGEQAVCIPCSTTRPTSVEMLCYNDGQAITDKETRNYVQDVRLNKVTPFTGSVVLASDEYKICTELRKPEETESSNFVFSCYAYQADAHVTRSGALADLFKDMQNMLQYPVITPSRQLSD
jgi:hypothetical protein